MQAHCENCAKEIIFWAKPKAAIISTDGKFVFCNKDCCDEWMEDMKRDIEAADFLEGQ